MMGGDVGVRSVKGEGSTFWFTARLDVGTPPQLRDPAERPQDRASPGLPPEGVEEHRRILVADDNVTARKVTEAMLRRSGFETDSVEDGAAAVEAVARAAASGVAYDLVVLDWKMPTLDGVQAAQAIRTLALAHPPKLLCLSAHSREEIASRANEADFGEILTKPIGQSRLVEAVRSQLAREVPSEPADPPEGTPDRFAGIAGAKVLVVEDNEINQLVATELLEFTGVRVTIAGNGREAIDRLMRDDYDLVLMDMQMPVMDGLSATMEIRARPQWREMPIIAVTANAMDQDRDRCTAAGMNALLAKPIEPDLLWEALLHWIPARSGRT